MVAIGEIVLPGLELAGQGQLVVLFQSRLRFETLQGFALFCMFSGAGRLR